jgi:hypothetical protein
LSLLEQMVESGVDLTLLAVAANTVERSRGGRAARSRPARPR